MIKKFYNQFKTIFKKKDSQKMMSAHLKIKGAKYGAVYKNKGGSV